MNKPFFLICIVFFTTFTLTAQEITDFARYETRVKEIKPKKIDSKSSAQAEKYKKQLNKAIKGGINFAGQYVVVSLSCGNRCVRYAIIDVATGKVFSPEILEKTILDAGVNLPQNPLIYKPDSRLLILKTNERNAENRYFEWTGKLLKEISRDEARGIISRVVLPIFKPAVSQMESKTLVPILLPAEIPEPKFLPRIVISSDESPGLTFYSYIYSLSENEYELTIDIAPDCKGHPNCNYGRVEGKRNSPAAPVNSAFTESDAQKAEAILLAEGISGFYIPAPDNPRAVIGSRVLWQDGHGNQYTISLKRAPKEDIIAAANSMIKNRLMNQ